MIAADDLIVVGQQYTYQWNATGWGWVHVVIGALVIIAGFTLMTGTTWARVVAVVLATIAIIANFLWLPYYPWWSLILIALYLYVIWGGGQLDAARGIASQAARHRPGAAARPRDARQCPRSIHSCRCGASAPIDVPSPCPVYTCTSPGSVSSRSLIDWMIVGKSE